MIDPNEKRAPKREEYDRPWEQMRKATDEEMNADQRRHEDGEPWGDDDAY